MPKRSMRVTQWQVVDKRDFDRGIRFYPISIVPTGDIEEAKYQMARAEEVTRRPVALVDVTAIVMPIQPLSKEETKIETNKRERKLRSGKKMKKP